MPVMIVGQGALPPQALALPLTPALRAGMTPVAAPASAAMYAVPCPASAAIAQGPSAGAAATSPIAAPASCAAAGFARFLRHREERRGLVARHSLDVGITLGAACAIASIECDLPTAMLRAACILWGAKTVASVGWLACQIHDFRAGEDCVSRRVVNWFQRSPHDVAS
jgi:hypothetical protein